MIYFAHIVMFVAIGACVVGVVFVVSEFWSGRRGR